MVQTTDSKLWIVRFNVWFCFFFTLNSFNYSFSHDLFFAVIIHSSSRPGNIPLTTKCCFCILLGPTTVLKWELKLWQSFAMMTPVIQRSAVETKIVTRESAEKIAVNQLELNAMSLMKRAGSFEANQSKLDAANVASEKRGKIPIISLLFAPNWLILKKHRCCDWSEMHALHKFCKRFVELETVCSCREPFFKESDALTVVLKR